jgi:hypothetical protein
MSPAILPWIAASMEVTRLCVTPLNLSGRICAMPSGAFARPPPSGWSANSGCSLAATGVVVGTVLALGLTRLIATFLYGVKPTDPLTYAVVATGLVAVACSRVYSPRGHPSRSAGGVAARIGLPCHTPKKQIDRRACGTVDGSMDVFEGGVSRFC